MSGFCDWHVQKAVYALLAADSPLTALLAAGAGSLYDHVPPDAAFPYVSLGEAQSRPHGTQEVEGREVLLTLRVFSRRSGLREVRLILAALHDALDGADLAVEGQEVVLCRVGEVQSFLENDGETRQGSLQLRVVTEPAA